MTEKLYYKDPYQKTGSGVVLECRQVNERYEIVLDQTFFYPEGGGQPGDTGWMNTAEVFDTHIRDGVICHYTKVSFEPGTCVEMKLDWERRFDYMQQHSGEHMVSGVIHKLFGYDNVGFHMGSDVTTIDFSGELNDVQLKKVESKVNSLIWEDHPVRIWYPDKKELPEIPYRSKKELTEDVRLVEFPDADICACCGTHVKRTGEIGLVKILGCEKFHGGARLEIVCGKRAAGYFGDLYEQNRLISQQLSAKPLETAKAVANLAEDYNNKRIEIYNLEEAVFQMKAQELSGKGNVLVFLERLSSDAVRRACDAIQNTCGGRCAVFSGNDETGYKYAVGFPDGDLREWVKRMNEQLNGRGGGKPFFVQGSVLAKENEIRAFFQNGTDE